MRRYETIIIADPDLSAEERAPVVKRVTDVIDQKDGYLALTDEWGVRKLAYEIKKKERGYYIRFDFCGTGAAVDEIERFFRIDDRVLKYMTVLVDKSADIEKIKEEIAAAQSKVVASPEPEQAAESQKTEEQAEPAEEQIAEKQAEPAEAEKTEEQTAPAEAQEPESEASEAEVAPGETEEETK